jgi:NhaA family Na+:H+ antiporter
VAELESNEVKARTGRVFNAPWERAFKTIYTPFEEFIHRQSTSGLLLLSCAVIALIIANSPLSESYAHILHTKLSIGYGSMSLSMSLHHWINDGLMALFFFLVGLELKREFLVGELSDFSLAILPAVAAVGGMVVPALFYFWINPTGPEAMGWGIPMATDIAFAVSILALLGNRVPKALLMFLVALAIVDDLGAIVVIAVFYTQQLNMTGLMFAVVVTVAMLVTNFFGVRKTVPYAVLGVLLWLALHASGIHATLAGVISAFAIPARPKYDPVAFSAQVKTLIRRFDGSYRPGSNVYQNDQLRACVQSLESGCRLVQAPLQRIEHSLHIPVTYMVIPLFALANAGMPLSVFSAGSEGFSSVTLGVIAGLVGGKTVGIAGSVWLAWKLGLGKLPAGCSMRHIFGVGLLGGIGFTMSIFIAELAFVNSPEDLLYAKAGVLAGSLIAGIGGAGFLYWFGPGHAPVPATKEQSGAAHN